MANRIPLLMLLASVTPVTRAQAPILHEPVPDLQPHEAASVLRDAKTGLAAILYEGELLPAPDPAMLDRHRPVLRAKPAADRQGHTAGQRANVFRPDRETQLEDRLTYDAGFTPTIAPFKRLTALDQVVLDTDRTTPLLRIQRPSRVEVPVVGAFAPPPDPRPRDRFWGEAVLDFSEGREVPLPSVAPEARILVYATSPSVTLRFERDGADNFMAVSAASNAEPVRLSFLTDAPRSYFGAPVPDLALDTLQAQVPSMPARVRQRALALARGLGIAPDDRLPRALAVLTEHFRGFEESAIAPEDSGDILTDLVQGKKGVCRHRSFGFVVLAQALGVPSRFVQNEAHAWVEVQLPGAGWMRIDLGGAAEGLEARGASDRPIYQPAYLDDLPRPPAYEHSYSQLRGSVQGFRAPDLEHLAGRWLSAGQASGRNVSGGDASGGDASHGTEGAPSYPSLPRIADPAHRKPARGRDLIVELDPHDVRIVRGSVMQVRGRVRDARGAGVPQVRVELSLSDSLRDGNPQRALWLGVTVSGPQGRFQVSVGIPPDLPAGDYHLMAIAPGEVLGPASF